MGEKEEKTYLLMLAAFLGRLETLSDAEQMQQAGLDMLISLPGVDAAAIGRVTAQATIDLQVVPTAGLGTQFNCSLAQGQGFGGWVALAGKPLWVVNPRSDWRAVSDCLARMGREISYLACLPLECSRQVAGVLYAVKARGEMDPNDQEALLLAARVLAMVMTHNDGHDYAYWHKSVAGLLEALLEMPANRVWLLMAEVAVKLLQLEVWAHIGQRVEDKPQLELVCGRDNSAKNRLRQLYHQGLLQGASLTATLKAEGWRRHNLNNLNNRGNWVLFGRTAPFTTTEEHLLLLLQRLAGVVTRHQGLEMQVQSLQGQMVQAVLLASGHGEGANLTHAQLVVAFTERILAKLQLSPSRSSQLVDAAWLHDIGRTPYEPLNLETQRRHPLKGSQVLERIIALAPLAAMVASHHENIDGSGFPLGLAGEQIPLGGRILRVAEFCAENQRGSLTAQRTPELVQSLQQGSGKQLDSVVVESLLEDWLPAAAGSSTAEQRKLGLLTSREMEVLQLVGMGLNNEEIAVTLSLSQATIKSHISNLLAKLGLSDRTKAAVWAIRQGIVKFDNF